jgi:hypothetical protein
LLGISTHEVAKDRPDETACADKKKCAQDSTHCGCGRLS